MGLPMTTLVSGLALLLATLAGFSLFSMKAPKGTAAMSGLANAAVATFLVEAIHSYISGDLLGFAFLGEVGSISGSMGGVAAAILVPISMGVNPVFAIVAGLACGGFGILPGFIAGYAIGFIAPLLEKHLPNGVNLILGALILAPVARIIATVVDPGVTAAMGYIGTAISAATEASPILMGFLLGGIIKMICTSPLSSMALTAMLGLTGLPMGIASIACFGGAFTNGMIFSRLKLGDKSRVMAVMIEPLTQADVVTRNPIPIYGSNFFGGGMAGIVAAMLGIVNNAPGTASPIPGMLAPFAFNDPMTVLLALGLAAVCGTTAGFVGSIVFKRFRKGEGDAAPVKAVRIPGLRGLGKHVPQPSVAEPAATQPVTAQLAMAAANAAAGETASSREAGADTAKDQKPKWHRGGALRGALSMKSGVLETISSGLTHRRTGPSSR